jgi:hypothetical protein
VRLSVVLLLLCLAGVLGGGALIGLPALGGCLIFDSLTLGAWALLRDDGRPADQGMPGIHEVPTLAQVLERARRAS